MFWLKCLKPLKKQLKTTSLPIGIVVSGSDDLSGIKLPLSYVCLSFICFILCFC